MASRTTGSSHNDNLGHRLAIDVASATVAAVLVTPIVAIMDRMVVERSCTHKPPLESFKHHLLDALRKPGRFVIAQPTLLVFSLYLGIFTIVNVIFTICILRLLKLDPPETKTATTLATLSTNVPLGIYKDTVYSRLFGCASLLPPGPNPTTFTPITPLATFSAFMLRDTVTIYSSFALPGILSSYFPSQAVALQLVVPALGQVLNTPVHLIGLEIYNKQGRAKGSDIVSVLRRDFFSASVTRMGRIVPTFGVGTLANDMLRGGWNSCLVEG